MNDGQRRRSDLITTDPNRIQDAEWSVSDWWGRWGSWFVTVFNLTIFFCHLGAVCAVRGDQSAVSAQRQQHVRGPVHRPHDNGAAGSGHLRSIRDHLFYSLTNLSIGLVIACVIGIPPAC